MAASQGRTAQPISTIAWMPRENLRANHYNPNRVAPVELDLLKQSILLCGWTQPIVARPDLEIIDGYHRWIVSEDSEVAALTDGHVPVVFMHVEGQEPDQMAATITHNRARGAHAVMKMADIVRTLKDRYKKSNAWIMNYLGMEEEEVERLYDAAGSPDVVGQEEFNKGWVPDGTEA